MKAIDDSLARLDMDYIDIYFMHQIDPRTPIEESMSALNDLVRDGKIRYIGISNHAAWQVMKAVGIAALRNWERVQCLQPMYSLVKRTAEVEILPMAQDQQIGVINYSTLGGGLLTGKYATGAATDESPLHVNTGYTKRYGEPLLHRTAEKFAAFAHDRGISPVTLAVAWCMRHPAITAPIVGARNLEQLRPSLDAADFALDDALYRSITEISPAPPVANDRTETVA